MLLHVLRGLAHFISAHFVVFAAGCILLLVLARAGNWLYRNEVFVWMQGGVQSDGGHHRNWRKRL